jgi:hypothetical protein
MLLATSIAGGSAYAEGSPGKTKVRLVAVDEGTSIRISGWVTVPASVANARDRRFVVLFSLSGDGNHERFRVPLNHQRHFAVVHTTKLTGVLKLQTHVSENGRAVGTAVVKTVAVADPSSTGSTTDGAAPPPPVASSQPSPTPEKSLPPERPPREPRIELCTPSVLPALEPGMGIVTGSFYLAGGPAPGGKWCTGADVTITTLKGEVVASKQVGHTESYAIAVPAGTYLINAVATGYFVNGQPVTYLENDEISVAAGSTVEIPIESQIP